MSLEPADATRLFELVNRCDQTRMWMLLTSSRRFGQSYEMLPAGGGTEEALLVYGDSLRVLARGVEEGWQPGLLGRVGPRGEEGCPSILVRRDETSFRVVEPDSLMALERLESRETQREPAETKKVRWVPLPIDAVSRQLTECIWGEG